MYILKSYFCEIYGNNLYGIFCNLQSTNPEHDIFQFRQELFKYFYAFFYINVLNIRIMPIPRVIIPDLDFETELIIIFVEKLRTIKILSTKNLADF